nr:hypothetical protein sensory transduction histidine kinase [uncultured archaeon GZfos26B2]
MLSEVNGALFDLENADRLSDGLTRIHKGGIDAVLLDLGLPDSSGLDTFEKVHDQAPEVPIVMLTGLDDTELALEGMSKGAQDYLVKGRADCDLLARTLRYAIERKAAEARIEHLNSVLMAIRNVNQLIVTETERNSLLRKSCDALVDARGYDAVWLGLLKDGERFATVIGSGFPDDVSRFSKHVTSGDHPPCIRDALMEGEMVLVLDKSRECGDCFFKDACLGKEAAVIRVEHADRLFGLLTVLLAPGVAVDDEEKGLLAEVASDIGIALHNSEIVEAHKVAEDALLESEERFRMMFENMRNAVAVYEAVDCGNDFIFKDFNRAAEKIDDIQREDLIGKSVLDVFPGVVDFGLFDLFQRVWQTGKPEHYPISFYEDTRIAGWRENYVYKLPSGEIVAIYEDVTERKAAEDALLESEEVLRRVVENMPVMLDALDDNGNIIAWNSECEKVTGFNSREIINNPKAGKMLYPDTDYENYIHSMLAEYGSNFRNLEWDITCKDGSTRTILWSNISEKYPILGWHSWAVGTDITERKAVADALKESEERYRALFETAKDAIFLSDKTGKFMDVNSAACGLLGYSKEELLKLSNREIDADPRGHEAFLKVRNGLMKEAVFEVNQWRKDGTLVPVEVSGKSFGIGDRKLFLAIARNITERKSAEEQIKRSLQEKEVMLREIHHRVKNNLQVVSSLLNMQARNVGDKETIEILSEARDRIMTMSLIHSQLYEGSDLAEINMKEFVDRLLGQLLQSYQVGDTRIARVIRVDDYPFPISVAVPVGLIINELLSNALKHAFDGRDEGKIEVSLTASAGGRIDLTVSDDGVGLPPGFNINGSKTLGLRLVKILTEDQLQGNMEVTSDGGATFEIEFETETD